MTVLAGVLLALLALGASGAAAARVLARRRPPTPPMPVTAGGEEVAVLPEAELLLQEADLDGELRRLLAQGEPEPAALPGELSHTR